MPVDEQILREALADGGTLGVLPDSFATLGEHYSGKVRENFTHEQTRTIIVTDRVSAFDVVLGTIPFKGQVLNRLAEHWFSITSEVMDNHVVDVPDAQVMRAVECDPVPIEIVVRGYLTGVSSTSIWRAYERGDRNFCGHTLSEGLRKHERLPANIVTPSTKAAKGEHDESVSKDELFKRGLVTPEVFDDLERRALELFAFGQARALERGMILVDTKYEIGKTPDGRIVLIDEIHTPDSSRYWYADSYATAMSEAADPKSLDKEYVRRWLVEQGFDGDGTPPVLPDAVRLEAARRYIETYETLTGRAFEPDTAPPVPRLLANLGVS